jgi:5-(carboxyamino)imidazole ribonucleotide mutase
MLTDTIPQIGLVVRSAGDLGCDREALELMRRLQIPFVVTALAALTPDAVREYGRTIAGRGVEVVVAIGGAAHLAGRIAAYTTLPVIVVPTAGAEPTVHSAQWGTLLASLETPPGVPLAVVGVDAVYNGIYLAVQFLGVKDHRVRVRLAEQRAALAAHADERAKAVEAYARELQSPSEAPASMPAPPRIGRKMDEPEAVLTPCGMTSS